MFSNGFFKAVSLKELLKKGDSLGVKGCKSLYYLMKQKAKNRILPKQIATNK